MTRADTKVPPSVSGPFTGVADGAELSKMLNRYKFNNSFRDGIQSNFGTNTSANEMLEMFLHTLDAGYNSAQVGGGTFMALFVDKARDAWGENSKLFKAFEGMIKTALIRGDCLVGYERYEQVIIDFFLKELQGYGLDKIENFHGNNDPRMQEGVYKAARKLGIDAPKVICVEDNPNVTVESCLEALTAIEPMASEGIYIKNAAGKLEPRFMYELVKAAAAKYPGEPIRVHTHDNHGLGVAIYMAALEAAAEVNADLEMDVLPRPASGGTAQPSAPDMYEAIQSHPNPEVRARAPDYKPEIDAKGHDVILEKSFQYRDSYLRYSKPVFDAAFRAGMAGGAMTTIKATGIPEQVQGAYNVDFEDAFIKICDMEVEVKSAFGYPQSVTPFQKIMTSQAGTELRLRHPAMNEEPFTTLEKGSSDFLIGELGHVPELVSQSVQKSALRLRGLKEVVPFIPSDQLPSKLPDAKKSLENKGYKNPSQKDIVLAAMYGDKGADRAVEIHNGTLSPQEPPEFPDYLKDPDGVAHALGGAPALERFAQAILAIEKHKDGFYKTTIGPTGHYNMDMRNNKALPAESLFTNGEHVQVMQKQWHERAEQYVQGFMRDIPLRLQEAGIPDDKIMGIMIGEVREILVDVVEGKAKGSSRRSLPNMSFRHAPEGIFKRPKHAGPFKRLPRSLPLNSTRTEGTPWDARQLVMAE